MGVKSSRNEVFEDRNKKYQLQIRVKNTNRWDINQELTQRINIKLFHSYLILFVHFIKFCRKLRMPVPDYE